MTVNEVDYKIRQPGSWAGVSPPAIIGSDVLGVGGVVDEVFYTPEIFVGDGSYGEYHGANHLIVAPKPSSLAHAEAASLALAGGIAWDALQMVGALQVGETVLVHGAGGVGSLAVQIEAVPEGVDLVLDTVGGDGLERSIGVRREFGALMGIVSTSVDLAKAGTSNVTAHRLFLQKASHKLLALHRLVERGQLWPAIGSVLPLDVVAEAHRRFEEGGVKGKIVLDVLGQ